MTQVHVIKVYMIAEFLKNYQTQLQEGENSYSSGNVSSVKFDCGVQPAILKGNVLARMKNRTYYVELLVDLEDGILEGSCSCSRNQIICYHMAALAFHGYYNITITEKQHTSSVSKQTDKLQKVLCLEEIFPSNKPSFCAASRQATYEEISTFRVKLNLKKVGFSWLISSEVASDVQ